MPNWRHVHQGKETGSTGTRPQLRRMMDKLREADAVEICSQLSISKGALCNYLRRRVVTIGGNYNA